MSLGIAIGTSDFRKLREQGRYYVDKSFFISQFLATHAEVLLLPRPRRFGKTLNLSMLHCFFDQSQESKLLFEGLAIAGDPEAMAFLNAYPTIFLTFKSIKAANWLDCQSKLRTLVCETLEVHFPQLDLSHTPPWQALFQEALDPRSSIARLEFALNWLTELLYRKTGKKVILLIDEYDTPIHEGHAHGYDQEIAFFMGNFLGAALKDNPYLMRAVLTGILPFPKASCYSGLNNLVVYSLVDSEFSTCFGFTETEVHRLLCDMDLGDKEAGVKAWYNGYTFGAGTIIYNPWSILRYASMTEKRLRPYWINSADDQLIRDMIQNEAVMTLSELEILLRGGTVRKDLLEDIAFAELNPDAAWSLMFFTGYLTARSPDPDEPVDLAIPNLEVKRFFSQTVLSWLGGGTAVRKLADELLAEDLQQFALSLAESVNTILIYHDPGGKRPGRVYHVFLLGLLTHLQDRYKVASERQAGHGRADLCLIPRHPGKTGFIFELKSSPNQKTLEADARAALAQIQQRDYLTSQRQAGVKRVVAIGLAFQGKRVVLASQIFEVSHQPSEPQTFNAGPETQEPGVNGSKRIPRPGQGKAQTPKEELKEIAKVTVVMQIQLLQQAKGLPISPFEFLIQQSEHLLKAMLSNLKPEPKEPTCFVVV